MGYDQIPWFIQGIGFMQIVVFVAGYQVAARLHRRRIGRNVNPGTR